MSDVSEPITDSAPVVVILSRPAVWRWLADALAELRSGGLRAIIVPASARGSTPMLARLALRVLEQRWTPATEKAQRQIQVDRMVDEVLVVDSPREVEGALKSSEIVLDLTETRAVPPLADHVVLALWHGASPATSPTALLGELLQRKTTVAGAVVAEYEGRRWEVASARTAVSRWSLPLSRQRLAGKTASLLSRALDNLRRENVNGTNTLPAPSVHDLGNPRVAVAGAHLAVRAAQACLATLTTRASWGVAWGARDGSDSPLRPPQRMNWVDNPDGRFLADPFLARDGRTFVFVEDFSLRHGYATIGVFEPQDPAGTFRTVLDRGTHLSYPFVFRNPADGDWLMLPEMSAERRVTLFRASRFPDEWREEAVLVDDVTAFDPTLLFRDGRYWLFYASGAAGSTADDELHLSSSDTLLGPYIPHPNNPVRSDAVGARPAGRLFDWNGRLIRPGQDSSREYGYAVVFYEITSLTTSSYTEVEVGRLAPEWAPRIRGTHSWDFLDDIVVADARRVRLARLR